MEILKIKQMNYTGFWEPVLTWVSSNYFTIGILVLIWKAIDKFFDYLVKREDKRFLDLIEKDRKANITPEIEKLSNAIDGLKDVIWEWKNKM